MDLSGMYYGLLILGFLLVVVPPIVPKAQKKLLNPNDFTFQVYIPTTIGFLFLMLGFYGILKDTYNERLWQVLIAVTATGSIFLSCIAGFQSLILLRWRSD
jgi:hypothetical protein